MPQTLINFYSFIKSWFHSEKLNNDSKKQTKSRVIQELELDLIAQRMKLQYLEPKFTDLKINRNVVFKELNTLKTELLSKYIPQNQKTQAQSLLDFIDKFLKIEGNAQKQTILNKLEEKHREIKEAQKAQPTIIGAALPHERLLKIMAMVLEIEERYLKLEEKRESYIDKMEDISNQILSVRINKQI